MVCVSVLNNKGENKIKEIDCLARFPSIKRVLLEFFEDDDELCCDVKIGSKISLI